MFEYLFNKQIPCDEHKCFLWEKTVLINNDDKIKIKFIYLSYFIYNLYLSNVEKYNKITQQ